MINKIDTFCQVKFLELFFDSIPEISLSEIISGNDVSKTFLDMSNLIYKKTILSVDDIEYIIMMAKKGHPFFKKLIKSSNSGGSEIKDYSTSFKDLLSNIEFACSTPVYSLHMYFDTNAVLIKSRNGWFTVLPMNWSSSLLDLSVNKTFKVDKKSDLNQFSGWHILKEINLPLNAAVIVDNYILDKSDNYENNIYMIIKNLLPNRLDHLDFDLSIVTKRDLINPKGKLNLLNSLIKNLQLNYSVKLTIYCTPSDNPHDRDLVTNYYRVHSGHSLDYFNNKGQINKDTTLQIVGLNGEDNNPHKLILKNIANVTSKGKLNFDMYGIGKNRLLNF